MNFDEYIKFLSDKFTVKHGIQGEYFVHKDKKVIKVSQSYMPSLDDLNREFTTSFPDFSTGRDDLHPPIFRSNRKQGMYFSSEQFKDKEINSDITPLKNKKNPDDDHLRKDGDNDNPFLY